jgi:hypothetical protein
MPKLPKLPLGIQAFETIRENGYLYVDKTAHVFRMVDEGMFYFLARPRRFGKSLLVSTLKCLFQGRRELFQGLWIDRQTEWPWKPHPVITIDFNQIPHSTPESLEKGISLDLERTAEEWKIALKTPFIETQFQELITGLNRQTGNRVVILVDEYDKPLIDHLGKGEKVLNIAKANRDILKRFFGVLKGVSISPMLRFVFLTGISKFSRVSIFSELNNLDDLTMNRVYSEMLGYTDAELERDLADHVKRFSEEIGVSREEIRQQLKRQYDGYRFSKKEATVYNPYSVLKALHHLEFKDYWFETATPTFLVNLLRERNYPVPEIEKMTVDEQVFSTYDLNHLKPEAILFQTGYVTIKGFQGSLFRLDYPNLEVRNSFLKHLVFAFTEGVNGDLCHGIQM